jgi:hypothetical protein
MLSMLTTGRLQQFSWVYAFGFLRVSQCLESGTLLEIHTAVQTLRNIQKLATDQKDYTIHLAASLMMALAYMNTTGSDALTNVQEALGQAWTNQTTLKNQVPQLFAMAHILQVACSIRKGNTTEMVSKLADMQMMMDGALRDDTWTMTSDTIAIPIQPTPKSSHVGQDTRAILTIDRDGKDNLMLSFLTKRDAYAIT